MLPCVFFFQSIALCLSAVRQFYAALCEYLKSRPMLCHARGSIHDKNRQNATNGTTKQQKNPPPSPGPIRKLGKRTNLYCRHHKDEFVCDFLYWEYKTFGPGSMLLQICKFIAQIFSCCAKYIFSNYIIC